MMQLLDRVDIVEEVITKAYSIFPGYSKTQCEVMRYRTEQTVFGH